MFNISHKLTSKLPFQIRYIQQCPPPKYDTGCTYCNPPSEMEENLKSPPESIRNTIPPLNRLIFHRSGNKDHDNWPKKVEVFDIMRNISKFGRGNGNMMCMSSLSPINEMTTNDQQNVDFAIYPDAQTISINGNDSTELEKLFKIINSNDSNNSISLSKHFRASKIDKTIVLICGHTQRDIRCGVLGKLIHKEFEEVLKRENLENDVELGYISHVGGHVYAGNLVILKPNGKMFWYGMVRPHHVQGLVDQSIKSDDLIEELSRQ